MAARHEWKRAKYDLDAMICDRCGLLVSTTEFAQVRDSDCDDWPTTKEDPDAPTTV